MRILFASLSAAALVLCVACAGVPDTKSSGAGNGKKEVVTETITITEWKVSSVTIAYPDGIVSSIERYGYDESGRLLVDEEFSGKNVAVSKKVTTYADDGLRSETVSTNAAGDILGKAVCDYESGFLKKESLYNPKGELQSTEEYTRDAAGNKTGWTVRTATGDSVATSYTLQDGKAVGILVTDAGGAIIKRYERTYDQNGLLVTESGFDADGNSLGVISYIAEKAKLVTEERRNASGGLQAIIKYSNDSDGNPVEERLLDRSGAVLEVKTLTWKPFTRKIPKPLGKDAGK